MVMVMAVIFKGMVMIVMIVMVITNLDKLDKCVSGSWFSSVSLSC